MKYPLHWTYRLADFPQEGESYAVGQLLGRKDWVFVWGPQFPYQEALDLRDRSYSNSGFSQYDAEYKALEELEEAVEAIDQTHDLAGDALRGWEDYHEEHLVERGHQPQVDKSWVSGGGNSIIYQARFTCVDEEGRDSGCGNDERVSLAVVERVGEEKTVRPQIKLSTGGLKLAQETSLEEVEMWAQEHGYDDAVAVFQENLEQLIELARREVEAAYDDPTVVEYQERMQLLDDIQEGTEWGLHSFQREFAPRGLPDLVRNYWPALRAALEQEEKEKRRSRIKLSSLPALAVGQIYRTDRFGDLVYAVVTVLDSQSSNKWSAYVVDDSRKAHQLSTYVREHPYPLERPGLTGRRYLEEALAPWLAASPVKIAEGGRLVAGVNLWTITPEEVAATEQWDLHLVTPGGLKLSATPKIVQEVGRVGQGQGLGGEYVEIMVEGERFPRYIVQYGDGHWNVYYVQELGKVEHRAYHRDKQGAINQARREMEKLVGIGPLKLSSRSVTAAPYTFTYTDARGQSKTRTVELADDADARAYQQWLLQGGGEEVRIEKSVPQSKDKARDYVFRYRIYDPDGWAEDQLNEQGEPYFVRAGEVNAQGWRWVEERRRIKPDQVDTVQEEIKRNLAGKIDLEAATPIEAQPLRERAKPVKPPFSPRRLQQIENARVKETLPGIRQQNKQLRQQNKQLRKDIKENTLWADKYVDNNGQVYYQVDLTDAEGGALPPQLMAHPYGTSKADVFRAAWKLVSGKGKVQAVKPVPWQYGRKWRQAHGPGKEPGKNEEREALLKQQLLQQLGPKALAWWQERWPDLSSEDLMQKVQEDARVEVPRDTTPQRLPYPVVVNEDRLKINIPLKAPVRLWSTHPVNGHTLWKLQDQDFYFSLPPELAPPKREVGMRRGAAEEEGAVVPMEEPAPPPVEEFPFAVGTVVRAKDNLYHSGVRGWEKGVGTGSTFGRIGKGEMGLVRGVDLDTGQGKIDWRETSARGPGGLTFPAAVARTFLEAVNVGGQKPTGAINPDDAIKFKWEVRFRTGKTAPISGATLQTSPGLTVLPIQRIGSQILVRAPLKKGFIYFSVPEQWFTGGPAPGSRQAAEIVLELVKESAAWRPPDGTLAVSKEYFEIGRNGRISIGNRSGRPVVEEEAASRIPHFNVDRYCYAPGTKWATWNNIHLDKNLLGLWKKPGQVYCIVTQGELYQHFQVKNTLKLSAEETPEWVCPECGPAEEWDDPVDTPFIYHSFATGVDEHGDTVYDPDVNEVGILAYPDLTVSNRWGDGAVGVPQDIKERMEEGEDLPVCVKCGEEPIRYKEWLRRHPEKKRLKLSRAWDYLDKIPVLSDEEWQAAYDYLQNASWEEALDKIVELLPRDQASRLQPHQREQLDNFMLNFHEQVKDNQRDLSAPYSEDTPSTNDKVYWLWASSQKNGYPPATARGGKWCVWVPKDAMDEAWAKVKQAVEEGRLGQDVKVKTKEYEPDEWYKVPILIYTYDWRDGEDVWRIRKELKRLGFTDPLRYHTDVNSLRQDPKHLYMEKEAGYTPSRTEGNPILEELKRTGASQGFYHGTTDGFLPTILQRGLYSPRLMGQEVREPRAVGLDQVYMTGDIKAAARYAQAAARKGGGSPVVIYFEIPFWKLLEARILAGGVPTELEDYSNEREEELKLDEEATLYLHIPRGNPINSEWAIKMREIAASMGAEKHDDYDYIWELGNTAGWIVADFMGSDRLRTKAGQGDYYAVKVDPEEIYQRIAQANKSPQTQQILLAFFDQWVIIPAAEKPPRVSADTIKKIIHSMSRWEVTLFRHLSPKLIKKVYDIDTSGHWEERPI